MNYLSDQCKKNTAILKQTNKKTDQFGYQHLAWKEKQYTNQRTAWEICASLWQNI